MHAVVGPIVTREGGYAFDSWTPEDGLSRGYSYRRVEDAHYARKVEIRSRSRRSAGPMVACGTVDEFTSTLAALQIAAKQRALSARHRV
jgi:hypothetical protein